MKTIFHLLSFLDLFVFVCDVMIGYVLMVVQNLFDSSFSRIICTEN